MLFSPKFWNLTLEFFGLFSSSPGLNFGHCVLILCVIAKKMNNMLVM